VRATLTTKLGTTRALLSLGVVVTILLKITRIDEQHDITFKLEGKLAGPWVEEMENAWHSAKQVSGKHELVVDLNEVTFIDLAGALLLRQMHAAGATFRAEGPYISHELRRITSNKPHS
jgi:hypothetical protein